MEREMDELIRKLIVCWKAHEDANENDYCSDEFPDYEGCRPDEIVNDMGRIIMKSDK